MGFCYVGNDKTRLWNDPQSLGVADGSVNRYCFGGADEPHRMMFASAAIICDIHQNWFRLIQTQQVKPARRPRGGYDA